MKKETEWNQSMKLHLHSSFICYWFYQVALFTFKILIAFSVFLVLRACFLVPKAHSVIQSPSYGLGKFPMVVHDIISSSATTTGEASAIRISCEFCHCTKMDKGDYVKANLPYPMFSTKTSLKNCNTFHFYRGTSTEALPFSIHSVSKINTFFTITEVIF